MSDLDKTTDPLENWLMLFMEDVESGSLRAATVVRGNALKKLREVIPFIAALREQSERRLRILQAILDADERGQGVGYSEAMDAAAKEVRNAR